MCQIKIQNQRNTKIDDTKFLIDTDSKLLDDITLKNAVILMTYVLKDDDNFYGYKR